MNADKFTPFAKDLLKKRYLKENEDPEGMFLRVAAWVAQAEKRNGKEWKEKFFRVMNSLDFLPNSPCIMNAGTSMPQLAACFVYPIEDDLESIFDTLKLAALTHKSGGGTGFSFSRLRPNGDKVGMAGGTTSGPVSFMEVYDKSTQAIRQGGKRRGANMGVLRVDHPDIEEFIDAKLEEHKLNNFNISIALTDDFMKALGKNHDYNLFFPPGENIRGKRSSKNIFDKIVRGAWKNGEPGVLFVDKINKRNPLLKLGEIEATNPCGEQPLLPYEACILGSVNLSNHVRDNMVDWDKLRETVQIAVRFLDNAIDVSDFPFKEIHEIVKKNRKIGLGVMGFASMLLKLEIPYSSVIGISTGKKVMKFINEVAHQSSEELADERGTFPNFHMSTIKKKRRNALVTTIAPTGSISIIAGTSSGIEPLYSLVIDRRTEDGGNFKMIEPIFQKKLEENKLPKEKIIEDIVEKGGIKNLEYIPEELRKIFLSATEIEPRVHVLMQAAFQGYVDNAISKTVNLPEEISLAEVKKIIKMAFRIGCKGITVYRQHSRTQQVLNIVCDC
jgi:ribonucleoside-diphosphate reductase alpha chain